MKVRAKQLSTKQRIRTLDALYSAAATVRGRSAMKLFLRDLLTESERIMLGRRILIAGMLLSGISYEEIHERLGVGHDTIYRVQRWLHDQFPGYERAIAQMERAFEDRIRNSGGIDKQLYATSTLYRLKKKYPMHFLLFPLPKRANRTTRRRNR